MAIQGRSVVDRIFDLSSPEPNSGCWIWEGGTAGGKNQYGVFQLDGKSRLAHRVSYQFHCGPIPEGLVIDHKCRNTFCVNPDHLEPVTQAVNNIRRPGKYGRPDLNVCRNGHPFTPENTVYTAAGFRNCRECNRVRDRLKMRRYRAARRATA